MHYLVFDGRENNAAVTLFDYDTCKVPIVESLIGAEIIIPAHDTAGNSTCMTSKLDINLGELPGSSIYDDSDLMSGGKFTNIKICARVDLHDYTLDDTFSSISFHKTRLDITVNMTQGFNSATLIVEEDADLNGEFPFSTSVDFDLNACVCTSSTKECIITPDYSISQNSAVSICVTPQAEGIIINSFTTMSLTQGGVTMSAIENGVTNSITETSALGTKTAIVTTRLVSVFFSGTGDLDPVIASGTVILGFESQGRRKLVSLRGNQALESERLLQIQQNNQGSFDDVTLTLRPNLDQRANGSSASYNNARVFYVTAMLLASLSSL